MIKKLINQRFSKKRVVQRLLPNIQSRDWPHQMKVFNELYLEYPNNEFWNKVIFNIDLTSLEYFKWDIGINLLHKKYIEFSYIIDNHYKEVILDNIKHGEDLNLTIKPKTIRDFINNGKK